MLLRRGVVVALAAVSLSACPGRLENPERFTGGGGGGSGGGSAGCSLDVENDIFRPKCGFAGCHGGAAPQSGLDLGDAGMADRIRTQLSSSACNMEPMVTLIGKKVKPSPPCGFQMPSGLPLEPAEIACVEEYLAIVADGGTP